MECTRKDTAVDLATLLQCYGSALPITVKIVEGFVAPEAKDSLEVDQILVVYKVERQKMIVAFDQFGQMLCVPQNSKRKVQLLSSAYKNEHSTIQELFNAYQTQYFLVLEKIPSVEISSETLLILPLGSQPIHSNLVKCQVIDSHGSREVILPLQLSGRFHPLLDAKEYYPDEVLARYQLPVNVRFVSQPQASDGAGNRLLSRLGNIRLTSEIEVEMVFAASLDDHFSLIVFPKTLDIKLICGFKVTAETCKKIKECRHSLAVGEKSLKRLDEVQTDSFYFIACPVNRFHFNWLQPPALSSPEKTENEMFNAKHSQALEELPTKTELATKRHCVQSASSAHCSPQDGGDYENFEVEDTLNAEKDGKTTDTVPDLPPKAFRNARSPSTIIQDVTQEKRSEGRRPVALPRKRLGTGKEGPKENINESVAPTPKTQGNYFSEKTENFETLLESRSSSDDDADDTCPELPPRPVFLKTKPPPPPLPPRDAPCGEGLAYLVTDVTDWRTVEERAFRTIRQRRAIERETLDTSNGDLCSEMINDVYTEVKDDGRVFRQNDLRHLGLLSYPQETEEVYIYMQDRQSPEIEGTQLDLEDFQQEDYLEPVEIGAFEDALTLQREENKRENNTRDFEKRGYEKDISNDEIEKRQESLTRIDSSAKNSRRKHTQPCLIPSPHQAEMPSRQEHERNINISPRRKDDFMEFEEIDQHIKRIKQLREAQGKLAGLRKQVTGKEQTLKTTQQPAVGAISASEHCGSQLANKDLCDETQNPLDSLPKVPNRSPRITTAERPGLECLMNRERDDSVRNGEERITSATSPIGKRSGPQKAKHYVDDCVNSARERKEMNKSHSTFSDDDDSDDDDDDFEEFPDSFYINKGTNASFEKLRDKCTYNPDVVKERETVSVSKDGDGIDGIYYNTVENPQEEEESVYVNVDKEGKDPEHLKDKELEIKDGERQKVHAMNDLARSVCESGMSGAPPLPPKKRASSLPDA